MTPTQPIIICPKNQANTFLVDIPHMDPMGKDMLNVMVIILLIAETPTFRRRNWVGGTTKTSAPCWPFGTWMKRCLEQQKHQQLWHSKIKKQKKLGILAHRNWEWFHWSFSYLTFFFRWLYSHPNHHPLTFGEPGSVKSNSWIPVPWWVQRPLNSWVSSTLPSTLIASFYYTNYSNYPGVFPWGRF